MTLLSKERDYKRVYQSMWYDVTSYECISKCHIKDVEFIIDAPLYQNISKLLVVITRADTVTKEQLDEVIKYTKSSIERQLKAWKPKDSQSLYFKTIKFIPISGRMALLHRTGREQEALDAGYTIEQTGILEIEKYLMETLFGSNSQKVKL